MENRYAYRLADACETLHMSLNGSADPLSDTEEAALVAFLRDRLANWTAPCSHGFRYDNAWREVVEAVLAEYEARKRETA